MRYDVVLVLYNSEKWLPGCIAALAACRYNLSELNLVFVDNASPDHSAETAQKLAEGNGFGAVTVLKSAQNLGFGGGCNLGARAGKAPFLFFLNADTEVDADVFAQLDAAIEAATPETAAFECRQLPYETGHHVNPVTLHTSWASGAALVVRRAAFEEIDGFDKNLFMYCEDVDLSWRLRAAGYTLQYVPRAEVVHYAYTQTEQGAEMKLGEYAGSFYGNLLLRYKYGNFREIVRGNTMYLGALRRPRHFPGVRRVLAKNYLRHLLKLWPFLFWRLGNCRLYKAKTAQFEGGFAPDRGLFKLEKPARQPLVSVVVRTHNRPNVLRETLRSLQHQTYPNFEVVVVEDGSEASRALVEQEFATLLRIRYHSTGDAVGRSRAGNIGLSMAEGEYLNFLDDDDYFYPDHLELLVAEAVQNPTADLVTAASMAMEAEVASRAPYVLDVRAIYPMRYDRMDNFLLCQSCLMPIQSILFKEWLFEQHGGLNEALEGDEDWSMWLKYFSVAQRIHPGRVDVPRATSVFVVPAGKEQARRREDAYRQYEDAMLDDEGIVFHVTPREMRNYYEGFIGDLRHLQSIGKLDAFLKHGRLPGKFDDE